MIVNAKVLRLQQKGTSTIEIASLVDQNIDATWSFVPVKFAISTDYLPKDTKEGDSVVINMTFTTCQPSTNKNH